MTRLFECFDRVRAIERELEVALEAGRLLDDQLQADPGHLARLNLAPADFSAFSEKLEPTYLIRLYAESEAILRDAWTHYFQRPSHPPMRDLLEGVAARRQIPAEVHGRVDRLREYRNGLVHRPPAATASAIIFRDARSRIGHYLAYLPPEW